MKRLARSALLDAQLLDARIQGDALVEQGLVLHADVQRLRAGWKSVSAACALASSLAHVRQLVGDELQALGRFGRVARHVLVHVGVGDLLEHLLGADRVGSWIASER